MNKVILASLISFSLTGAAFAAETPEQNTVQNGSQVIRVVGANEVSNRVSLSAIGQKEVDQNYLTMTLSYTADGVSSKNVQQELSQKISAAIEKAKTYEDSDKFRVKSGQFSVYPKYQKQKIMGWTGQGSVILEGTDFDKISKAASEMEGLVISDIGTSVSPELSKSQQAETTNQAISNFKQDAQRITEQFGFSKYTIKEVSVSYEQPARVFRGPMMAMAKADSMQESNELTVQPGKTNLTATVSGTIEMGN